MASSAYEVARARIDSLHKTDPAYEAHQRNEQLDVVDELQYADSMERWVGDLLKLSSPTSSQGPGSPSEPNSKLNADLVRLAARCQHLERFKTPRSSYPDGKAGYLRWRSKLYVLQADRAREVLLSSGLPPEQADQVHKWVRKAELKPGEQDVNNPGSQLLEDAAVLVFLEKEIHGFAQRHKDYTEEKFVEILVKTLRKVSPHGVQAVQRINMPPAIAGLLQQAAAQIGHDQKAGA